MYIIIIIFILIIILISILYFNVYKEYIDNTSNDLNIFPPTKIINHTIYKKIKCIDNNDTVCNIILNNQVWEQSLFENYFKPYIKDNTTIIECGAYIGSHTLLMKNLDKNNDILVFEMMPEHYKLLQDNIKLNNLNNILTFNFALGDRIDKVKLPNINYSQSNNNYGGTSLDTNNNLDVDIPMITLDYFMPFINKLVSFIKIDVEGFEVQVLMGAKEIITKYKPVICIEIWKFKYDNFINSDIWKYFQTLNYNIKHINNDDYLLYI